MLFRSFTSSDDTVATVDDNGLVTAVAPGTADITVESIADGSKTAVCTLTVTEPVSEPENVQVETTQNDAEVSAQ